MDRNFKALFIFAIISIIVLIISLGLYSIYFIDESDEEENEEDDIDITGFDGDIDMNIVNSEIQNKIKMESESDIQIDSSITSVTDEKSDNMASEDYVSTVSPGGQTTQDRINMIPYTCLESSEILLNTSYMANVNTSYDNETNRYESEEELAEGIFNEAYHRSDGIITDENWTDYGFGVSVTDSGDVYASFIFCDR